jgi:hypothetical protein
VLRLMTLRNVSIGRKCDEADSGSNRNLPADFDDRVAAQALLVLTVYRQAPVTFSE